MNSDLKYEKINIELRRGKVLELLSKGYNQRSIAEKLNVSDALISLDIQWIREQSKEGLRTHMQEKLPYEFARAMTGINDILRRAQEILDSTKDPTPTPVHDFDNATMGNGHVNGNRWGRNRTSNENG